MTAKKDEPITSGKTGMENLDRLFRRVVSVSNKAVQDKMKAEKRRRQRARKKG